jgi:hypothetical protein
VSGWLKREISPENLRPEIDGFLAKIENRIEGE